jgi:hypothetical protein
MNACPIGRIGLPYILQLDGFVMRIMWGLEVWKRRVGTGCIRVVFLFLCEVGDGGV